MLFVLAFLALAWSDEAVVAKEADAANATATNTSSTRKEGYYPKRMKNGIPVDENIDRFFTDALYSYTNRETFVPRYNGVPSWHWAMLNDIQRNSAYRVALTSAVTQLKNQGKEVRVLDIGSGTGLLAMMAARAGASHVTTCEENPGLITIAQENVKRAQTKYNNMCPVVVVGKRSTNLTVGAGMDMEKKANLLVSEIVDSMLLRESIIPTLQHAMDELVEKDAIVIPWGGKLNFMMFESKEMRDTHYLDADVSGFDLSHLNEAAFDLTAQGYIHDYNYRAMSNALVGMDFALANASSIERYEFFALNFTINSDGVLDGAVMWLDLNLYGDITLSCDPRAGKMHFPHWQHVFFFPRAPVRVRAGDILTMVVGHGETSVRTKFVYLNGVHFSQLKPYRSAENAYDTPSETNTCASPQ